MNSRRLITDSSGLQDIVAAQTCAGKDPANVRFGSKADMCAAKGHVRFTPKSDHENGFPHKVMSALPPKADMCGAMSNVPMGQ